MRSINPGKRAGPTQSETCVTVISPNNAFDTADDASLLIRDAKVSSSLPMNEFGPSFIASLTLSAKFDY